MLRYLSSLRVCHTVFNFSYSIMQILLYKDYKSLHRFMSAKETSRHCKPSLAKSFSRSPTSSWLMAQVRLSNVITCTHVQAGYLEECQSFTVGQFDTYELVPAGEAFSWHA